MAGNHLLFLLYGTVNKIALIDNERDFLAKINKIFEVIAVPISKKSYNLQQK